MSVSAFNPSIHFTRPVVRTTANHATTRPGKMLERSLSNSFEWPSADHDIVPSIPKILTAHAHHIDETPHMARGKTLQDHTFHHEHEKDDKTADDAVHTTSRPGP